MADSAKVHDFPGGKTPTQGSTARDKRHAKVRASIISAAETIFLKEGEIAVSMRRLAEETDYSPAALYKYFGSKREVFEAVRESFFEKLVARLDDAMAQGNTAVSVCKLAAHAYVQTALENPGTYLMAYSSWGEHERPEQGSFGHHAAEQLQELISTGVKTGEFASDDIALSAKSIWASVHGLTSLLIQVKELPYGVDGMENYTVDQIIDHHVAFMLRGLRPI